MLRILSGSRFECAGGCFFRRRRLPLARGGCSVFCLESASNARKVASFAVVAFRWPAEVAPYSVWKPLRMRRRARGTFAFRLLFSPSSPPAGAKWDTQSRVPLGEPPAALADCGRARGARFGFQVGRRGWSSTAEHRAALQLKTDAGLRWCWRSVCGAPRTWRAKRRHNQEPRERAGTLPADAERRPRSGQSRLVNWAGRQCPMLGGGSGPLSIGHWRPAQFTTLRRRRLSPSGRRLGRRRPPEKRGDSSVGC